MNIHDFLKQVDLEKLRNLFSQNSEIKDRKGKKILEEFAEELQNCLMGWIVSALPNLFYL